LEVTPEVKAKFEALETEMEEVTADMTQEEKTKFK